MRLNMNKINDVRTGVIGTGIMGTNHARVLSKISSLQGITDVDKKAGMLVSKQYNTIFYDNMFDLLKKVDAVCIAVPTEFHYSIIMDIINFNDKISILVEKPLAHNIEQCNKLIDIVKEKGINIFVGHIERFNPVVLKIQDLLSSGDLGEIISISTKRVSPIPVRIRDVGVVMDLAIHDIDVVRHLISRKINRVSASNISNGKGIETHSNLLLSFDGGVSAICEVSWNTPVKIRELSLTCTKAYVRGNYATQELEIINVDKNKRNGFSTTNIIIEKEEPLKLELIHFLKATIGEVNLGVSIDEATEAVRVAHLALISDTF